MMKYSRVILFFALSLTMFTGCFTEDDRNCPDTKNVKLRFSLLDKNGNEVFMEHVGQTDLYLFDASDRYHSYLRVASSSLDADQGMSLTLDPGTYTLVSWGNIGDKTAVTALDRITTQGDGRVVFNTTESGDPLFYGASPTLGLTRFNSGQQYFTFTVPADGQVNETVHLTHAHHKIDIYVKGYSVNGKLPGLEVEGNRKGFLFCMARLDEGTVDYTQSSLETTTNSGSMANAWFNVPRVKEDNDIRVHILNPETGVREWTVTLNEVIESYTDFDLNVEIVIPILFEYFDGRFTVKLKEWETEPAKPGLE